ncbi:MAG: protein of unknown function (DUF1489) [Bacteriophage sp.]|uniref:Uncharacterized protein n=1 Tax=Myoviridae sp. ctNQV2 TaxID=2827683 RepID=A0A8S5S067_9CAUD|nr:MAG: protein of unknown function DUF1489 [Bacteriophage sp.]DAF44163.1 MAG TPA: Protein of unknown function (DUF1489) [Myoviridae sp. ctNQV2]UVX33258.1 MAG: protein of unknown function (DUF1489) [Bacteriophage sp.]UVY03298.1 MAG: Protein of unknown function (DUF1489) [Bacteriophage sp.]UWD58693.1 MAG: Protein of unknown function (DUF1489) [Bacteriophage sp.]
MADSNLNLVKIFEDVLKSERAIVVTLPSSEQWEDYQKEMDAVKDYSQVMNFKVPFFPKGINKGDKCYIVHDGKVKGWMEVVGMEEKEFTCSTTGRKWMGKFIMRSGPFHPLEREIPMKGFQGFRYFNLEEHL